MSCQKCESPLLLSVNAKCSDLCSIEFGPLVYTGTVPTEINIGGYDYVEFEYCLHCGQIQGDFPVSPGGIVKLCQPKDQ